LTTSRLFYFNGGETDIFGAETNTIGAEKDKFGAETDELIFFKLVFTLGSKNEQKVGAERLPKLVDSFRNNPSSSTKIFLL
jgi:hypothetical protein